MFANWFHQSTSFHFQSVGCFARMHSHTHTHMQNKHTHLHNDVFHFHLGIYEMQPDLRQVPPSPFPSTSTWLIHYQPLVAWLHGMAKQSENPLRALFVTIWLAQSDVSTVLHELWTMVLCIGGVHLKTSTNKCYGLHFFPPHTHTPHFASLQGVSAGDDILLVRAETSSSSLRYRFHISM